MARVKIEWSGQEYMGESLSPEENELLLRHVYEYLAAGNDFLGNMFRDNEKWIRAAAQVAKFKLDAGLAGMLAPDNMVGISHIRPGHILRNTSTTESALNTWDTEAVQAGAIASGTDNWIGYSTNNGTAVNIDKDALIIPMGIGFTQGQRPAIEAVQYIVGRITFPQVSSRHSYFADNPNRIRAVRHHPLLLQPKETFRAISYSEQGARQEMVLLGLTFGLGRYLRTQAYTTIST